MARKRSYGKGTATPRGNGKWQLRYFVIENGESKRKNETISARNQSEADSFLKNKVEVASTEKRLGPIVPMKQLFALHIKDMRREGRENTDIEESRINKRLMGPFGDIDSNKMDRARVLAYVDARLEEKIHNAPATINRELSAVRRSLAIGVELGLVTVTPPIIKPLKENNVRKGFIEEHTYRKVLLELPAHYQMLFCFAYYWGIRKGELLKLEWDWLLPYWQEEEPIIKVPGKMYGHNVTKTGEPHTLPIYHDEMRAFIQMAMTSRNPECPYLFQRDGKRIKSFKGAFKSACERAGVDGLMFHDTRRTAIRWMEQAGIPRAEAMQITGHKTESVYGRYCISSERGAVKAGKEMREFHRKRSQSEAVQSENWRKIGAESETTGGEGSGSMPANLLN